MLYILKVVATVGLEICGIFCLQMAWTFWKMPYWQQRELEEQYYKRRHEENMIRFWLRGQKDV